MSYQNRLLGTNERVLRRAHRHVLFVLLHTGPLILLALVFWLLAGLTYRYISRFEGFIALVLMIASLVPLGIAVYRFLWWRAEEYMVTNFRIIQVQGILSKRTLDSSLGQVNDVEMKQSVFGRMFDFGDINIVTGSDVAINDLIGIDQPFQFKRALIDAKSQHDGHIPQTFTSEVPTMPGEAPTADRSDADVEDTARVLAALSELRNSGVLSEAEYQKKLQEVMTS